jgi:hypothetical protein
MTPDRPTPHDQDGCVATVSGLVPRSSDVLVDPGLARAACRFPAFMTEDFVSLS